MAEGVHGRGLCGWAMHGTRSVCGGGWSCVAEGVRAIETATEAGGTLPTGMHSCFFQFFLFCVVHSGHRFNLFQLKNETLSIVHYFFWL